MNGEYPILKLQVHYKNNLNIFWKEFVKMDSLFRISVGLDCGDIEKARAALERGTRAHLFAFVEENAIGFRRLDFYSDILWLGAVYVLENYRGQLLESDCSWLNNEKNYRAWQFLTKAGYILGKRTEREIDTFIHNKDGERTKAWASRQVEKWDKEALECDEPIEFINFVRETTSPLS